MSGAIGGFFELEIGGGRGPYHDSAPALSSGRACLRWILESIRPSRAWVPFYLCDAALQAFDAAGVSVEFYPIDDALDPMLTEGSPATGECLMYVNYFGLKSSTARSLIAAHPGRIIIDDTHAFFVKGYSGAWSFNSARKFFGVADGGYAYGPALTAVDYPRAPHVEYDHLVNRLLGRQRLAFEQYQRHEAAITADLWRMSVLSERLLARVEYDVVRERRRRNFAALSERFDSRNCLKLKTGETPNEVPFCYPLLAPGPFSWDALWSQELYIPRLWPELADRSRSRHFARELLFADRLLSLPIDHRYECEDINRLADIVTGVIGW